MTHGYWVDEPMAASDEQRRYLQKAQDVDSIAWVIIRHTDGTTSSFASVPEKQVTGELRTILRGMLANQANPKIESWRDTAFGITAEES